MCVSVRGVGWWGKKCNLKMYVHPQYKIKWIQMRLCKYGSIKEHIKVDQKKTIIALFLGAPFSPII